MQTKTIPLIMTFLVSFLNATLAQELTIKSLAADPHAIIAVEDEKKDLAGKPCGLVKVQLPVKGAVFDGCVTTVNKIGEYWVYMEDGSYMLTIKHPNYLPLSINFHDYGIEGIEGKRTYILSLQIPQTRDVVQKQKLIINYTPADAMVLIDSKLYKGNGHIETNLALGSHTYIIAAEGYETAEGSVKLNGGSPRTITENLVAMVRTPAAKQQAETSQQNPVPLTDTTGQHSTTSNNGVTKSNIETFTVNGVSFNMVRVDGGTFTMGATPEQGSDASESEKPAHQVTLSTYYIGETEVTQALWEAVMGSNPSKFKGSNLPVERVSWDDCQTFVQKLNELTGRRFRLPTEAEWEYAARGGDKSRGYKYSGSNNIDEVAWYTKTTNDKGTRDVKTKKANELGLYDMSGNVYEWCQDWYGSYSSGSQTNPSGPASGSSRVCRGGGWFFIATRDCRSSARGRGTPSNRGNYLGLRLAL